MDTDYKASIPQKPIATYCLIAINILVFLLMGAGERVYSLGAINHWRILEAGQYYRLVSAMFLHANIEHLFFNMIALFMVGSSLEAYIGHARFLMIYLIGGLFGSIASVMLNPPYVFGVGASGAVFATYGGQQVFSFGYRDLLTENIQKQINWGGRTIVLNFINGIRPGSNVDNWAHLGGLIGGIFIGLLINSMYILVKNMEKDQALVRVNHHPRLFRLSQVICILLFVSMCATGIPLLTTRTITLDNIVMHVPPGWSTMTNFKNIPPCQEKEIECLVLLFPPHSPATFYLIDRVSGFGVWLTSLEQTAQFAISTIEEEGFDIVSQEEIAIGGRKGLCLTFADGDTKMMLMLVKDQTRLLRLQIIENKNTMYHSENDATDFIANIRFINE